MDSKAISTTITTPATPTPVEGAKMYPARFYRANVLLGSQETRMGVAGAEYVFWRVALVSKPEDSFHVDGTKIDLTQGIAAVTLWDVPPDVETGKLLEGILVAPRGGEDGFNYVGLISENARLLSLAGLDASTLASAPYPRPIAEDREEAIKASREQRRAASAGATAAATTTAAVSMANLLK